VIRDANIWRVDLPRRPGELARPIEFISSSRLDFNPQYGPDGDRIVFSSNRTGSFEIWTANTEGSGLIQLTSFGGPQVGSPRWSPDQQQIVFDCNIGGESRIYTVGAQGGKPQVMPDTGPAVVPSWSRDGNWIYYGSNRTGRFEVWRVPAKGGPPIQITRNGGFVAYESWDAQTLYYAKTDGPAPVFRMSLASVGAASGAGEESQVLEGVPYRAWAVTASGLWFIDRDTKPRSLKFRSFSGKTRTVAEIDKPVSWGLTVSPDERTILYSQLDQSGSDLMLVEGFR